MNITMYDEYTRVHENNQIAMKGKKEKEILLAANLLESMVMVYWAKCLAKRCFHCSSIRSFDFFFANASDSLNGG